MAHPITRAAVPPPPPRPPRRPFRLGTLALTTSLAATLTLSYLYATDTRASYHQWLVPPLLRAVYPDAEEAHHVGTRALKLLYELGLNPRERPTRTPGIVREPSDLAVTVFDTTLANPIGISAGLDKDAEIPDVLFDLGAGVVEVGGCTPHPQEGNPKPRVWRVPAVEGMVNRYGLNSRGADAMAARLRERVRKFAMSVGLSERAVLNGDGVDVPPGSLLRGRLLCVQVAKQKETDERDLDAVARDYVYCVNRLAPYADVLVVNVSSPNTPGLRDLQAAEPLGRILAAVVDEAQRTQRRTKPKVMVKVSPDEDEAAQMEGIVQAVYMSGVDGVIVGNTTKRRAGLVPEGVRLMQRERDALMETGGFSGPAMFERTLDLVGRYRKMLDGFSMRDSEEGTATPAAATAAAVAAVPAVDGTVAGQVESGKRKETPQKVIFATGGIKNGEQALKVLNAGASVAMVYTGMVYGGAGTVTRIKGEMRKTLENGSA
ncbi:FMN-linked oxidoreductase [Cryphonectria parasitica EP155]|uniref:FMN-linked oxidoreductase n=1 Tax=Cryphonectria parasitica (strain ATCC 38755 / EP155) TaxID=660469 RepID=A0A9P4Y6X2_CRYP1|nr:FMN-linked oxidoreductase [Cryphonectria parasitica EP155]KAF3767220.1 FMN-linked oxidoreductase [Cryphonectria parasitica EP155]